MAFKMKGAWVCVEKENYRDFLKECLGLPMYKYSIAEYLSQHPTFEIRDGGTTLHCTTHCKAAIPVEEEISVGHRQIEEPNMTTIYEVDTKWVDGVLHDVRVSPDVNGGKPIRQRRWVDEETGRLHHHQNWGTGVTFVSIYERAPPSAEKRTATAPVGKTDLW